MVLLEWLGTGSGLNQELGNTSFILHGECGRNLLADCGFTVPSRLLGQQYLSDVTDVLITHLHADHVGGLEYFGFMSHNVLKHRDAQRPKLHVASYDMAHDIWTHCLKAGMERQQDNDNRPFAATLETYFDVGVHREIALPGLPKVSFFPTQHVQNMENYGLLIGDHVLYSGDTVETPNRSHALIFQDCHFNDPSPADVHISYTELNGELSAEMKRKTHLVHLGAGWKERDPAKDGFAGFVMPGQRFNLDDYK